MRLNQVFLAGLASITLALNACGGGGASPSQAPIAATPPPSPPTSSNSESKDAPAEGLLRDTYAGRFKVGAALYSNQVTQDTEEGAIVNSQFNSIGAEYEMKPDFIAPEPGVYNFEGADRLVDYAVANDMEIRFHALLWHESTPDYFLEGTREDIKARLEAYITTVVTRYRDRVKIWDVVNEVVTEDANATDPYRQSNWQTAVGNNDYIDWAFQAARAADPDAILFINDYGTRFEGKRNQYIEIIQDLLDRGIPLDGVGHQFHIPWNANAENVLASIDAVDNLFAGLVNHVTEMDVSVYTDPGECWQEQRNCDEDYGSELPQNIDSTQARLVKAIFEGLAERPSVEMVHFWGVSDGQSWLNFSPIERTNYPLLFDREFNPKTWFYAITDPNYVIPE